jgi:hypothetical protein
VKKMPNDLIMLRRLQKENDRREYRELDGRSVRREMETGEGWRR